MNGFYERQKFQIENFNEKLWIHQHLTVHDEHDRFLASSIIPRIYQIDLAGLHLINQSLTFDQFKRFTSSGSLKR